MNPQQLSQPQAYPAEKPVQPLQQSPIPPQPSQPQVSPTQQPMQPPQQTMPQYAPQPPMATKPPISTRIYYWLSMLGMAAVLAVVAIVGILAPQTSSGLSPGTLLLLVVGTIVAIGQFYLTHVMRSGKRWALIANTVVLFGILVAELVQTLQRGEYKWSFSIVSVIFFIIFWTKDRKYFR